MLDDGFAIRQPRLRPEFSLQVRPADELCAAVKRDGFPCQMGQVTNGIHNLAHHWLSLFVRILQNNREPADPLDQGRHVRLPELLFELSMSV